MLNVTFRELKETLGSLSSDVSERRTSTGSEPFSLAISLYATVFVLPSVLILKGTICPKICSKARLKCAKSLFPVDVRRSKTSLLKLPIIGRGGGGGGGTREVQKKYSRKGKLNEKNFMHAN